MKLLLSLISLEVEQDLRMALDASKLGLEESHNLDIARLKSDRDIAQSVTNELRLQNEKLNLIIAKEATKFPSSTSVASSCHTNPLYEKDPPKGDERLDELLLLKRNMVTRLDLVSSPSLRRRGTRRRTIRRRIFPFPLLHLRSASQMTYDLIRMATLMSTHASILVDSFGPRIAEVCRTAASFP
jgi:hypothetical protein